MADLPAHLMALDDVLLLALREESPLWELPLGSECGLHGEMVFHPPPDLTQASTRLRSWLDAGLIELVENARPADWQTHSGAERHRRAADWHPAVPEARAREVLADPTRWTHDSTDGLLALTFTDRGVTADADAFGLPGSPSAPC